MGNDDDLPPRSPSARTAAFAGMKPGAVFTTNTTASADVARELAVAAARAACRSSTSVSGGQAGAENGVLTVMVGGEEAAYAAAER